MQNVDLIGILENGQARSAALPPSDVQNISVPVGSDWTARMRCVTPDDEVLPVPGATFLFTIKNKYTDVAPKVARRGVIEDVDDGLVSFRFVPDDTAELEPGEYLFDVWMTDAADERNALVPKSTISLTPALTLLGETGDLPVVPAPTILSLNFVGGYPSGQTELKAGDTFQVRGTLNLPAVGVEIADFGAAQAGTVSFTSATTFTVPVTIADRGNAPQFLTAKLRSTDSQGAHGAWVETANVVTLNNLHPSVSFGAKTYPGSQLALKGSETAAVAVTLANADSVVFDSPNGDLSITAPTVIASSKTVTRIAGSYNVATNNLRATATRAANGAVTIGQDVVAIANVAPVVTVTPPASRLRSGGNDGTVAQSHVITLGADQQLLSAPTLNAGVGGGTFSGSWAGGPSSWTRSLVVNDSDTKGSYAFSGLVATGLSGLVQNSISGSAAYVLGGFVARDLTFAAFEQSVAMGVAVSDYTKLQATEFTATGVTPVRNPVQGNTADLANTFTVLALNANPTTVFWCDVAAASTNSSGTAQILQLEEVV